MADRGAFLVERLAPGRAGAFAQGSVISRSRSSVSRSWLIRRGPRCAVHSASIWAMTFAPIGMAERPRSVRRTRRARASAGSGAEVVGPIAAILPLLAGRTATLPELTGAGVARLLARRPAPN